MPTHTWYGCPHRFVAPSRLTPSSTARPPRLLHPHLTHSLCQMSQYMSRPSKLVRLTPAPSPPVPPPPVVQPPSPPHIDPSDAISRCIQAREQYAQLDDSSGCTGSFCTVHPLPLSSLSSLPVVTVDGVGQLAFPLLPSQCQQLIGVAQQAPFGRGERTVVDVAVRNTWQVDASAVHLDAAFLSTIHRTVLPQVCSELGLWDASDIQARLYKLLVYDTGGFFRPHRDSEKEDGMFGTLVLLLPAEYSGGQLVVEHAGQRRVIECSESEQWRGFWYAAFYADCKHEVRLVTSGYRVALTFNLCKVQGAAKQAGGQVADSRAATTAEDAENESDENEDDEDDDDEAEIATTSKAPAVDSSLPAPSPGSPLPSAASVAEAPTIVRKLAAALNSWCAQVVADDADTSAYVLMLKHEYTQSSLAVANLKSHDRALMALVDRAVAFAQNEEERQQRQQAGSSAFVSSLPPVIPLLCLFSLTQRGYEGCGDNEWEVEEVEVKYIAPPDLHASLFSALISKCTPPLDYSALLYTEAGFGWVKEDADDEEKEYTGNEGTNIDRFYHRAGILLLPRETRWSYIADHVKAETLAGELHNAAAIISSDEISAALHLVTSLHSRLASTPSLYPTFLTALGSLYQRATGLNEGNGDHASHMQQISALMDRVFAERAIDFSDVAAPAQLDNLASARGMDAIREPLVMAFRRNLIGFSGTLRRSPLSLLDAVRFLLRLFVLRLSDAQSRSANLTVSASAARVQGIADDQLPALVSGLPHSADGARLPAHWIRTASKMCTVLCGELTAERLQQTPELYNAATASETVVAVLLLFVLYDAQRSGDAANPAAYMTRYTEAAGELCEFACQRLKNEWSEATADDAVRRCIQHNMLEPLLPLVHLLTKQIPVERADESHSLLLDAILPLPQALVMWLQSWLAAVPQDSSWCHPSYLSPLFAGQLPRWQDTNVLCTCEHCLQLKRFLESDTEHTIQFRMAGEHRKHIERGVEALRNPHLRHSTIRTAGTPHILRIEKRATLASLGKERRAALQAPIDRLSSAIADMTSASSSTSAPSSSSSSTASRPPLQLSASQRGRRKDGADKAGYKRKHDVIELDVDEDEADKENRQREQLLTADNTD